MSSLVNKIEKMEAGINKNNTEILQDFKENTEWMTRPGILHTPTYHTEMEDSTAISSVARKHYTAKKRDATIDDIVPGDRKKAAVDVRVTKRDTYNTYSDESDGKARRREEYVVDEDDLRSHDGLSDLSMEGRRTTRKNSLS